MTEIRKPKSELRAYIHWNGMWRHVYIISGFDQQTLLGDAARMLEFKLSKNTKITYSAEKMKFHARRPSKSKTTSRENWS